MNSADLITSFFNNEMSPDQEREFLLSVASSDSMRLGLKSHVILDKILVDDSNGAQVPQDVRQRVFREAAIVAGLGAGESASDHATPADRAPVEANHAGRTGSFVRRSSRWVVGVLTLMLCSGSFFAGYSIADDEQQQTEIGVVTPDADAVDGSVEAQRDGGITVPEMQRGSSEQLPSPSSIRRSGQNTVTGGNDSERQEIQSTSDNVDDADGSLTATENGSTVTSKKDDINRQPPWIDLGDMSVKKSDDSEQPVESDTKPQ